MLNSDCSVGEHPASVASATLLSATLRTLDPMLSQILYRPEGLFPVERGKRGLCHSVDVLRAHAAQRFLTHADELFWIDRAVLFTSSHNPCPEPVGEGHRLDPSP